MNNYQLVEITWGDAWSDIAGRYYPYEWEKECKPVLECSVGRLLHRNEEGVLISWEMSHIEYGLNDKSHSRDTQFIPAGMIKKLVYLKADEE